MASRIFAEDRVQTLIATESALEEWLSRPNEADVDAAAQMRGDLMLLGAAGKMGPTLAMRAQRAAKTAGSNIRVIAVSRFSTPGSRRALEDSGIETLEADLLDRDAVAKLPEALNIIFLAGRKFGSTGDAAQTWAMNVVVPAIVCERFRRSRIVALSSGNVYPFTPLASGGAHEKTPPNPVGEYAQSVLGRERTFEYASGKHNIPIVLVRLNYAVEMRYGVLLDIGTAVFERRPVDISMGAVNVIWQGDANSVCLRAFELCASPPAVLNLTGPETLSVRFIAESFASHFNVEPIFTGQESATALLNNAGRCHRIFGYPRVSPAEVIELTADWIRAGGATLNKPTHFQTRDGQF